MMKKLLLITVLVLSCSIFVKAQEEQQEATEKKWERMTPQSTFIPRNIVKEKEPISYMPYREADITWSRIVWRTVDCREKINFSLYYPTTDQESSKSLVQALWGGIQTGEIQAYDPYDEAGEFKTPMTAEEVKVNFGAKDESRTVEKIDGSGQDTTIFLKGVINWGEVREFLVKEEWYFDRHYSQLFVRIIGICPVRVFNKTITVGGGEEVSGEELRSKLFWVYFPETRRILANTLSSSGENDLAQISFDDLLHKRRFSSYITAMSNNLNDRKIVDYTRNGVEAMMEAERIKKYIMNYESDLWEY